MMFPNMWAQRMQNPIYPGAMPPPQQMQPMPQPPMGIQNGFAQRIASPVFGGSFQMPQPQSMMRPAIPQPMMPPQAMPQMPPGQLPQQQVQNALRMRMGMQ